MSSRHSEDAEMRATIRPNPEHLILTCITCNKRLLLKHIQSSLTVPCCHDGGLICSNEALLCFSSLVTEHTHTQRCSRLQ